MKNARRPSGHARGFTLIEIAIALMVIGLLMAPLIAQYNNYRQNKALQTSRDYVSYVQSSLNKYVLKYGRYPIPARPAEQSSDPRYGMPYKTPYYPAPITYPTCITSPNEVCTTVGARPTPAGALSNLVYIGTVPFAALGIPEVYSRDGYGMRLTYAVTAELTDAARYNSSGGAGVIAVFRGDGTPASGLEDTSIPFNAALNGTTAQFVVVSHGSDNRGGYAPNGTIPTACAPAGTAVDQENCDKDAIFINGHRRGLPYWSATDTVYKRTAINTASVDHYDDFVEFVRSPANGLWQKRPNSPDVYFPVGNVLIGSLGTSPTAQLQVVGNIRATNLFANRLCESTGCGATGTVGTLVSPGDENLPNVFSPAVIGGTPNPLNAEKPGGGILCSSSTSNKPMTGISYSNEECNFNAAPGVTIGTCTAPLYPRGISATGTLICL